MRSSLHAISSVWLDCDPGHDDAIAIILAGHSPRLRLVGISTVAGNQSVDKTTKNALKVLSIAGLLHIPVVMGQDRPLLRKPVHSPEIHGVTGLDGPIFPPLAISPVTEKAVAFMYQTFRSFADRGADSRVTLVITGPMTNIALLLTVYPEVKPLIKQIVFLGGARGIGNTGSVAEFNIQVDPEAAHIVLESGLPITMVPLEVSHTALVTPAVVNRIIAIHPPSAAALAPSAFAELVVELLQFFANTYRVFFGFEYPPLHDPCAVAYVINPELFKTVQMRVDVELSSHLSYGQTVCDSYHFSKLPKNVNLALSMDVSAFWDLVVEALTRANAVSSLNLQKASDPSRSRL